jgi:DNA-directed RNA polymerase specialized sigma24 family protein
MTVSAPDWPASPLAAADAAFAVLTCQPAPLTLDADSLGPDTGLPAGVIPLPALRDWLLAHPRAYPARDAVWRELIRRARLDGPAWVIAAVGMAMPALRRYAGQLAAGYPGDPDDLDAEILTGFLGALRDRVDPARTAPYAGLCRAAWRAGHALRRQAGQYTPVPDVEHVTGPRSPTVPYGHPDLLVRRAVTLGLLEPEDERPYIDVRLGRRAVEPIAARLGITVDALRMRLGRIDQRLTDALAAGLLTGIAAPQATRAQAAAARHRTATRHAAARRATPPTPAAAA